MLDRNNMMPETLIFAYLKNDGNGKCIQNNPQLKEKSSLFETKFGTSNTRITTIYRLTTVFCQVELLEIGNFDFVFKIFVLFLSLKKCKIKKL